MTNVVIISGKLEEIFDMTNGVRLGKLVCDNEIFYIYWEDENFTSIEEKNYVCIQGKLTHIKYKREENVNVIRISAVKVENMERVEL